MSPQPLKPFQASQRHFSGAAAPSTLRLEWGPGMPDLPSFLFICLGNVPHWPDPDVCLSSFPLALDGVSVFFLQLHCLAPRLFCAPIPAFEELSGGMSEKYSLSVQWSSFSRMAL
jgi:hypothetical protein